MKKESVKQSVVSRRMGVVSILIAVMVIVLFLLTVLFSNAAQKASIDRFDLMENANRFINGSKSLTNDVRDFASTGNRQFYDSYMNEVNVAKNREIGVANMQAIGITDKEQRLIDQMAELSNELVPLENEALQKSMAGDNASAVSFVYGEEYNKTVLKIYDLADEFSASLEERSAARIRQVDIVRNIITAIMGIIIAILIALQVINMLYVKNELIAPILKVRDEMREIAKGNLSSDFDLPIDTSEVGELSEAIHESRNNLKTYVGDISDKLGQMAAGNMNLEINTRYVGEFESIGESIKIILNYMNKTISDLKEETETVANAVSDRAAEVASSSQQMATSAADQSETVEGMVVSVNDLTDDMDGIVEHALDAEKSAIMVTESLKENTRQMQAMEEAMKDISDSSEGIKSIIDDISSIASQTNLLALNASIEAARAGEAGKGFAVVAEEVRVLSEECRDASMKTNALIEQSLSAVKRGVDLTSETFRSIEGMMESVKGTSDKVKDIAESCKDKVGVLHDIRDMFDQLSEVVHNSAGTAKESADAADELNGHAEQLSSLFESFSLKV